MYAGPLFAVGLAQDLLTGAPVGVGALVLLLARAAVLRYRRYFINRTFPFVWSGFTLLAAGAMLAQWALHYLLQQREEYHNLLENIDCPNKQHLHNNQ